MNFGHIKNIHFVGIGGIGMSGIAEILTNYDLTISGCDAARSATTERLGRGGIEVVIGHDPSHADRADLLVISSAIRRDNPEVERARAVRVPVIRRAEMLGELTRLKRGIAVAGTHGKTTTSAMIAMILAEAGLDPTLIVGGVLRNLEKSARLGSGEYLVVEADEYDRSFLTLYPHLAVVTNIEADHLDIYRDLDDIRATFAEFVRRVPFYGAVIACSDDSNVIDLLSHVEKREIRYGLSPEANLRAVDLRFDGRGARYRLERDGESVGEVRLRVPGEHNVRNSLAAIAVALELDVPFDTAAAALQKFDGVERRFQILGACHGATVVDDYAHHPTEVRATLEAARHGYPGRRIVALFQPHLYSRTRDFASDFAEALSVADLAWVAPIYPAREEPIEGVTSALITGSASTRGMKQVHAIEGDLEAIANSIEKELSNNDIFITLGAGDVYKVGHMLTGGAA
ncbi:MAG TPA: UDP-N-acetylmuramate--L-alanine ligase [Thermoanaerobaculia bacterium]|nr:UDP-N-acetylmuramate--L-alanine ligase [Thermoanaerobaculia bacterium]